MNRRAFLQSGTILGGGLLISFTIPQANKLAAMVKTTADAGFAPNAFLNIATDNTITVYLSHVEMGQGIWTTLPMLLADELDVDLGQVTVKHSGVGKAYNHTVYGIQITGGSSSTWSEFDRYRNAGATARMLLTQAAAKRSGVAVENCKTENGHVIAAGKKYTYGELAAEAALLQVPQQVPLRPKKDWKYIGKGAGRMDAIVKTNGEAKFGLDIQFPGLLTAVVAHAPVFGGKVKSFDAGKAMAIPGVVQVVQIPTGVAVIANHFWAAQQGRKALQVNWDNGAGADLFTTKQTEAYKKLAATNGLVAQQKGDAAAGLIKANKVISAQYVFPYLAHAPMEPMNCTVNLQKDSCEIWTGTQLPGVDQLAAAKILGMKPEQVTMNVAFLGGGFGRRATPTSDFVSEAVHIAKASGKPVKMVWTREDDMKGGYYRGACVHDVSVGLNEQGLPIAWRHNIAGQSIMAGAPMFGPPPAVDDTSVEGVKGSPYLTKVPDHFIGLHTTKEVVPILWFRSVGNTHTGYVMEAMLDELAHAAGRDAVDYRRALLKDHPRHLAALNLVADKGGWEKPAPQGRHKGVAVHEAFGSYVAIIAEVSINNGQVRVHKIDCAIDCGLAVNPDGVKAQMESGIIFGLTMALYGEITLENGKVQQSNFYDYRIARMNESPEINVFIADSNEKMGGAGECAVPPTAPAIVNAIFAATGKRIYNLPIMNHKLTQA
ncbi:xanthine dehydrogenase family protein molybdopterin-binding subunit [Mucilaginibacter sp. KACC 22773]|uniref:xanthine dehydrogenase family protein molybdopterin-binding subunit n=1 Tax=Mucilaginibacter sp. KACC 22773 TaxID=3025671 RepID=UPI002366F927|nr:xanthine dehydrogenase family protein molybdopterin-binding subunit [Mucilaginibacter sp. KACC 22773]WDF78807.1 xanthine dehydrogenase family protein molybdopterin-binding subunit [Mucilaginibacter sp. KACC 22773]